MNTHQSTLNHTLAQGQFAVTVELNPPKGTDVSGLLETAKSLSGRVHGINVPDNAAAVMRASPVAVARLLYEQGHDPVLQLTCRDRNRLGLQSDLLGAHVLGIRNVLCLTGDSPSAGDHKDAKPVFDLDTVQLMHAVQELNQGRDLAGNTLEGRTAFFIGGAVAPGAEPVELLHKKFEAKVNAGAQFFQTHLASSSSLATEVVQELRDAGDAHASEAGIEIAVRTIRAVRPFCDGVHLMAGRLAHRLPEIIRKAELN